MSLFFSSKATKIKQALGQIPLPESTLTVADAVTSLEVSSDKLSLFITLGYPMASFAEELQLRIEAELGLLHPSVEVQLSWAAAETQKLSAHPQVAGVKNVIAVASGKGGVGKSTTAVNIALALANTGARVGLLDADIYGPSQSLMLGVEGLKPEVVGANTMKPIMTAGNVQLMGMGNLVNENTPMIWRGPMVSGAFKQLLNSTLWDDVDYLIIDMPPGTGDVQLTLSQSVAVSGAVIITTPQDIALLDARKGIEMFKKVNVPILGVVENMSTHTCTNCGHEEAIFGDEGGDRLSKEYGVRLLGRLPLQASIRQQTDSGTPPVLTDPNSAVSQKYRSIALQLASGLWGQALKGPTGPTISVTDD